MKKTNKEKSTTRREFLKTSAMGSAGIMAAAVPVIDDNSETAHDPENPYGDRPVVVRFQNRKNLI